MLGSNSISRKPNSAGSRRSHRGNRGWRRSTTHVKRGRAGVNNLAHYRYLYVVLPATCLLVIWRLINAAILSKGVQDQHGSQIKAYPSAFSGHKCTTGANANCTPMTGIDERVVTAEHKLHVESVGDARWFEGKTIMYCQSFAYRVPHDVLHDVAGEEFVVVGVLSAAANADRRQMIRSTWGNNQKSVFFLVAGEWDKVSEEFFEHSDLIWIDTEEGYYNTEEGYYGITQKTALFLVVVDQVTKLLKTEYSYALKTDDDSYVALDRIRKYLADLKELGKDYAGKFTAHDCVAPLRDPQNRYSVSFEEYPEPSFSQYAQGGGIFLSKKFVECASSEGNIANMRYLKFEDAYVGLLARRCGMSNVHHIQDEELRMYRSGLTESEGVVNERERINFENKPWEDDAFPAAEMAGRLIQHRINSDQDMIEHHNSLHDPRLIHSLEAFSVDNRVDYFYNDAYGWSEAEVVEVLDQEIKLHFLDDDVTHTLPLQPYLGKFRKPLERQQNALIPTAQIARTGYRPEHQVSGVAIQVLRTDSRPAARPTLTDSFLDRFIVVPEYKLLFCYMEKTGCSMFNHLFRMLRLLHPNLQNDFAEASFQAEGTFFRNTPAHHKLDRLGLEMILKDPEWTKATFYRDPMSRFLSAFRSKCERTPDKGKTCQRVFGDSLIGFEDALDAMTAVGSRVFSDEHFAPMSFFCGGLRNTLENYDLVEELNKDTVKSIIRVLFDHIGVNTNTTERMISSVVRTGGTNLEEDRNLVKKIYNSTIVKLQGGGPQKKVTTRSRARTFTSTSRMKQ